MSAENLDCVLIGYYDVAFQDTCDAAERRGGYSAYWEYLKHNSVLIDNRRLTYMQLLNRGVERATGHDRQLHVARLPNLASCYLFNYLHTRGHHVQIVNCLNHDSERLIDLLKAGPRAVAISTTLYLDSRPVSEIVNYIRSWNSDACIIVGGPYIAGLCRTNDTAAQDSQLLSMGADVYVNDSQGEFALSCILTELRSSKPDLQSIDNLVWRDGDQMHRTRRSPEDNAMDENAIDWSLFDPEYLGPTVQTRTARSCAFKCTFCSHPQLAGKLTLSSVETIEREMQQLQRAGCQQVVFIDDTFNVPLPRFKDICRMMIRNEFDLRWYSFFRCSNADAETFDLMAESGCAGVFLGIESGDDRILRSMDKFSSLSKLRAGVNELNRRDIVTFASFIVGFPGETDSSVENTIRFIEETRPRFYRAELWFADPLTPIMARAKDFNLLGGAFSWSHKTMDWKRGSQWVREMYQRIRGSAILPIYDFDFWSIPYLVGRGIDVRQIERFASLAGPLMVGSLDGRSCDGKQVDSQLAGIFSGSSSSYGSAVAADP